MITDRVKISIKSIPFLYNILQLNLTLFNKARDKLFPQNGIKHFRRFCLNLGKIISEPVFVKVGANDGISGDPCSDIFLGNNKWRGLLIEPVPYIFERLKLTFRDTQRFLLEQVAIGSTTGKTSFYFVDDEAAKSVPNLPQWIDQLGSFDKNHILKHLNGTLEPFIIESTVDVYPLSNVLEKNGIRNVTVLHIDCEGYDYEVLKTLNFSNVAPLVILIEHTHLAAALKVELLNFLHNHGYSVEDCGFDYFAINQEAHKRIRRSK